MVRWHVHSNEVPADADVAALGALVEQMLQTTAAKAAHKAG